MCSAQLHSEAHYSLPLQSQYENLDAGSCVSLYACIDAEVRSIPKVVRFCMLDVINKLYRPLVITCMNKSQRKKFVGKNMRLDIISDKCCDQINAVIR